MNEYQVDVNAVMQSLATKIANLEVENAQLRVLVETITAEKESASETE